MLFGLLMALTFVGAVSVATAGRQQIDTMFAAALACNLGWGLVDGIMYLVKTITDRGHSLTLVRSVRATADAEAGRKLIERSLSPAVASLFSTAELEELRGRLLALPSVPQRPSLGRDDLFAALAICLIVVAATLPVVLPYALISDVGAAKLVSRAVGLAMLFFGGLAFGRYAGYGTWKAGVIMMALGTGLVGAIMALGG
jgi:VIT1/CCC1 family predicted Fe2+/Mn2+ transporter